MPLTVPHAIERFRRRLQVAGFVKGAAVGLFGAGALAATALLGARLAEVAVPAWGIGWPLWAAVGGIGLLAGAAGAAAVRIDDRTVVEHLEARLATDGLLLAANDGVELEPAWRARLERQLAATDRVLPAVRWRSLWLRPVGALLVLAAMQLLPAVEQPAAPAEAASLQVARLSDEVEQLARRTQFDAMAAAELRQQVRELERRIDAGDTGVWRDIDQLSERVDRERRLAQLDAPEAAPEGAGSGVAAGGEGAAPTDGQQPSDAPTPPAPAAGALANGLEQLAELDPDKLQDVIAALPEGLQAQVAQALGPDGQFDPQQLPEGEQARNELGAALGEAAQEALEGLEPEQALDRAEELAALAQEFLGGDQGLDTEQLTEKLAEAAEQMTDLGMLDAMPDFLKEALMKAAIDTALAEIKDIDIEKLKRLLPDDLSELEDLAKKVAELAEGASRGEPSPSAPSMPELSKQTMQQLAGLAEGLREQFGAVGQGEGGQGEGGQGEDGSGTLSQEGQPGGQPGDQPGDQPGPNEQGAPGFGPGEATAQAGETGGHDALRMTEQTEGGAGSRDFELPGTDPDKDPLPGEWTPVAVEKAAPEVGEARPAGVGREGAESKGTPTWQLRLMPRHRDVVRRFFADKKKKQ